MVRFPWAPLATSYYACNISPLYSQKRYIFVFHIQNFLLRAAHFSSSNLNCSGELLTFSSGEGISLIAQRLGSAIPEIVTSFWNFLPISGISIAASGVQLIDISGSEDRQANSIDWDFRWGCWYCLSVGGGRFRGDVFSRQKTKSIERKTSTFIAKEKLNQKVVNPVNFTGRV